MMDSASDFARYSAYNQLQKTNFILVITSIAILIVSILALIILG